MKTTVKSFSIGLFVGFLALTIGTRLHADEEPTIPILLNETELLLDSIAANSQKDVNQIDLTVHYLMRHYNSSQRLESIEQSDCFKRQFQRPSFRREQDYSANQLQFAFQTCELNPILKETKNGQLLLNLSKTVQNLASALSYRNSAKDPAQALQKSCEKFRFAKNFQAMKESREIIKTQENDNPKLYAQFLKLYNQLLYFQLECALIKQEKFQELIRQDDSDRNSELNKDSSTPSSQEKSKQGTATDSF